MKTNKPSPDKFKMIVKKQDEPEKPKTLGEPVAEIDWYAHADKEIEYYTILQNNQKGEKMAYVYKPNPGMKFFLRIEDNYKHYIIPSILTVDFEKGIVIDCLPVGRVQFINFVDESVTAE